MTADYITLSNGKRYRVEVNLNAIENICRSLGIDDFSRIENIGTLKINEVKKLIHSCVSEGERMDGRTLAENDVELAANFRIGTIQEFMAVFNRQSAVAVTQQKKRNDLLRWMRSWGKKQPSTT